MRPILAAGKDIVSINFSSALSTTYQSACIAAQDMKAEFPDANIYVVDSLSASLGQGLLLYLTVQKKREGLSAQELVQWVEDNKLHIDHWFTVDDLNYLKMGGRLSAGAAFFGSMLSIKPVMQPHGTEHHGHILRRHQEITARLLRQYFVAAACRTQSTPAPPRLVLAQDPLPLEVCHRRDTSSVAAGGVRCISTLREVILWTGWNSRSTRATRAWTR